MKHDTKNLIQGNTICEKLYRLRDAVNAHKLQYALMLSREVHDKLAQLVYGNESIECTLDCEIKDKDTNNG